MVKSPYSPTLEEFREKAKSANLIPVYREILADPAEIDRVLADGAARADAIAAPIMHEVRELVGFWRA